MMVGNLAEELQKISGDGILQSFACRSYILPKYIFVLCADTYIPINEYA